MKNPFSRLNSIIESRTRSEWQSYASERLTDFRIWIQENGEKAALVAFVAGLIFVIAFRLFVFLLLLACVTAFLVWYLAPQEKKVEFQAEYKNTPETPIGPLNGSADGSGEGDSNNA